MKRKIIEINEEKCNGCGACAAACHEGAIEMVDGKAKLVRADYCDGLGDCLPVCPTNAISFLEIEVSAKDTVLSCGCPGSYSKPIERSEKSHEDSKPISSHLSQWPVQIKLAPIQGEYFNNADLLIAADCVAYAYGDFHRHFIKGRVVLIGCPKLDSIDYSEKLTEIIRVNNIKSVTLVRMEVPCCGGLEHAARNSIKNSGKHLPFQLVTISLDGKILNTNC